MFSQSQPWQLRGLRGCCVDVSVAVAGIVTGADLFFYFFTPDWWPGDTWYSLVSRHDGFLFTDMCLIN